MKEIVVCEWCGKYSRHIEDGRCVQCRKRKLASKTTQMNLFKEWESKKCDDVIDEVSIRHHFVGNHDDIGKITKFLSELTAEEQLKIIKEYRDKANV